MATYNLGKIGLKPRGEYSASAAYEKLDFVNYEGSSYVALENCIGVSPEDETKWMLLAAGTTTNAMMQYVVTTADLGEKFVMYSDTTHPVITRIGPFVYMVGYLTTNVTISGSTTLYTMFTLPEWARPAKIVSQVCQGSSATVWWLRVEPDGKVNFSRYRDGSSYDSFSAGNQLPFSTMWIAADAMGNV